MNKKILVPVLVLLLSGLIAGTVAAQSADRIDELLGQNPAQSGHVAYLVLAAAGIVPEGASPAEALRTAQDQGLMPAGTAAADPVTFGRYSYLFMESFGVTGGVMYRIIPGPRYAAREVVYQRWTRTRRASGERISGETAMRILSVYLNRPGRGGA
jgi:hypothetical protein